MGDEIPTPNIIDLGSKPCGKHGTRHSDHCNRPGMPLEAIRVGMRLRNIAAGAHNQIIVTALTETGFRYRIADDEEIMNEHWSMSMLRDGHEAFAINGRVFWESVRS